MFNESYALFINVEKLLFQYSKETIKVFNSTISVLSQTLTLIARPLTESQLVKKLKKTTRYKGPGF